MTLLRKLACLLVGHDVQVGFEQWERSPPWVVGCSRCGKTWQMGIKERKP